MNTHSYKYAWHSNVCCLFNKILTYVFELIGRNSKIMFMPKTSRNFSRLHLQTHTYTHTHQSVDLILLINVIFFITCTHQGSILIFHCNFGVDIVVSVGVATATRALIKFNSRQVHFSARMHAHTNILLRQAVNFARIFLTTIKNGDYFNNNNSNNSNLKI